MTNKRQQMKDIIKEKADEDCIVLEPHHVDTALDPFIERTESVDQRLIRHLNVEDRPREKMLQSGISSLSETELVAVLIGTGQRGESALLLAETLLFTAGNHEQFMEMTLEELMSIKGIGLSKASRILAGIELGKRFHRRKTIREIAINNPQSIYNHFSVTLRNEQREHFIIVMLDTKNKVIGEAVVSIGNLNSSIVHPREVFKVAIKRSAHSLILVHNHPSGDPEPSQEDLLITERLIQASKIIGIDILDHIIIGYDRFYSMKQHQRI